MPDTPPTPTVLDRDRALAAKFWRFLHGGYTWAPDEEEEAKMAAEIAAAREAWGVSREAVAGLVEAAENWTKGRHAAVCVRYPNQTFQPWMWCECRLQALYDALKRVKPKARLWAHKVDDLNRPMETMRELP